MSRWWKTDGQFVPPSVRETGGTGLIAELVRVEKEGGQISRDEMVAMVFLLLLAGTKLPTPAGSPSFFSGSAVQLGSGEFGDDLFAHHIFLRLAGRRHRKLRDEADVARHLVVGNLPAAE
jgi:hypothetical protein